MIYGWLADAILIAHLAFVLFVSLGSLLALVRRWWVFLHLPCLIYGLGVEWIGWICPLTPLEQQLRLSAGQQGYSGGFIDHYVGGLLYPDDWAVVRWWLGGTLVALNLAVYAVVVLRARSASGSG